MALPVPTSSVRGGNLFETIISAMVIVVATGFAIYFFILTGTGHLGSYPLRINMANASGLSMGTEVRLAGVKIGSVTHLSLDQKTYRAVVEVSIRDDLVLARDTSAQVASSPFGDVYLTLVPGHAREKVRAGATLGSPPPVPRAGV